MSLDDVPDRVVAFARSQVLSQLGAARAGLAHDLGRRTVRAFGSPTQEDPRRAAYVLAALTMCLDFDDTVYAGHVSHSTVNVPIAYAAILGLNGRAFLESIIAANECAARITASATLGHFRGQTAAHAHLAGAVAARLRAEGGSQAQWVDAWGIAFAAPPWALYRAFMGSDAKIFTASVPIGVALDACDAAAAGLRGAPDILEHRDGFLAKFSSVPLPQAVIDGLGERWHTETLSFKVYPGCAYIDAALDCARDLYGELGSLVAPDVEEIVVRAPVFTVGMNYRSGPYVKGPDSTVAALNFSVAYNVAVMLARGALGPADFGDDRIRDSAVWDLAARVRVEHDPALSRRALLATAPVGEALRAAGPRAAEFLGAMDGEPLEPGAPAITFEQAEKAVGARVEVRLVGGRTAVRDREIPIGAAGPDTRREHPALMREKFLACGGSQAAADAIGGLETLSPRDLVAVLREAMTV